MDAFRPSREHRPCPYAAEARELPCRHRVHAVLATVLATSGTSRMVSPAMALLTQPSATTVRSPTLLLKKR